MEGVEGKLTIDKNNKSKKNICFLCRKKRKLMVSHITPKFVTNWIKKTSITKGLRRTDNINQRLEDGVKIRLLCDECEAKFSKYESNFAEKIFYPCMKGDKSFKIDEKINKFVSSISWRILVSLVKKEELGEKELNEYLRIEKKLRDYLLDRVKNPYDNYLFFFSEKLNFKKPTKEYFWYIDRASHMYWIISEDLTFVYFSFPKMFFVTQVKPSDYSFGGKILFGDKEVGFAVDGKSNLITEKGEINKDNLTFLPQTEEFLIKMANPISSPMTDEQQEKLGSLMEKNKGRILKSESFKTFIKSKEK